MTNDNHWMTLALEQARAAQAEDEVPVGAVIVRDDKLIATGRNGPVGTCDPTAHAEIAALRAAGRALDNYRLPGCTLYVTLEPCQMCAGAIVHARIERLVFGADDPRAGAVHSVAAALDAAWLNHRTTWTGGVRAGESSGLLQAFFRQRRARRPAGTP
ncbi:tRNA adenosine(34) deaminase TadA [Salinisphaera sp. P385]|uniref:tRNA-specific adenosine deaminase n=1 Tax=Spectribacter acetivorans TaxID=3075603 RepID=A0ABU3B604_9GAMM|nr:tRNA adenosine(34) deaminase TadA [Salinisphaera sp. P385]MDT0617888.1 tRNA adenosine(34) deaminase TadA [Salinisphaera sp. P385]